MSSIGDLTELLLKVNELMPQLSDFISQFNNIVVTNNVNVITDAAGNMSLDVPNTMSDADLERISQRIGIIDRLITTRGIEIDELLQKSLKIEAKLKQQDPTFSSQILEKVNEFKKLNACYKH